MSYNASNLTAWLAAGDGLWTDRAQTVRQTDHLTGVRYVANRYQFRNRLPRQFSNTGLEVMLSFLLAQKQ